jgi:hypothetical protein
MSEHKKDDDSLEEVQVAEDDCIIAEQPQPRRQQTRTVRTRLRPFEVQTAADGEPFDTLPMKKTC